MWAKRKRLKTKPCNMWGTDTLSESEFRAFLAPMAVVAAVKEINGEADHKPNDKPQPSIARQTQH
jgi:hypothetical protein